MTAALNEQTQFVDSGGKPLVGGFIYFGIQNSDPVTNPISIFSDRALTIAIANPQQLDSLGRSTNKVWLDGRYSLRIEDLNNVQIYQELDNGEAVSTGVSPLDNILGGDTIAGQATPSITSYVDLQQFIFTTVQVNTGAVTLNINSVGAKAVLKNHDQPIESGEFEDDQVVIVAYNGTDDVFEWVNHNNKNFVTGPASAGDDQIAVFDGTTGKLIKDSGVTVADVSLPRGYIDGFIMANNGTDPDRDVDIGEGAARDDADTDKLALTGSLTKQLDATWVVGNNQGGLDTGSIAADTTYHVFVIKRTDTGTVDVIFSTTFAGPALPTDYDKFRRIGSLLTDASSNIFGFNQFADFFQWKTRITSVDENPPNGIFTRVLQVPTGQKLLVTITIRITAVASALSWITQDPDLTDITDSDFSHLIDETGTAGSRAAQEAQFMTNTSGEFQFLDVNSTISSLQVSVIGYEDLRGKN